MQDILNGSWVLMRKILLVVELLNFEKKKIITIEKMISNLAVKAEWEIDRVTLNIVFRRMIFLLNLPRKMIKLT